MAETLNKFNVEVEKKTLCNFDVSGVMPGKKILHTASGIKIHWTEMIIVGHFQNSLVGAKVGFLKFACLHLETVYTNVCTNGTHFECVCTVHQNVKLML